MRGEKNRPTGSAEFFYQCPELSPRLRIESSRRLIEKQKLGISDESTRNSKPLFLSSGQRAYTRFGFFAKLHDIDHFLDGASVPVEASKKLERLRNRQLFGELRVLKLNTEPLAKRFAIVLPLHSEYFEVPGITFQQPFTDFDSGGLPGAIGAEQAEALACFDLEVEAVHCYDVPVGFPQPLQHKGVPGCHH
jgi:hypothetical protein